MTTPLKKIARISVINLLLLVALLEVFARLGFFDQLLNKVMHSNSISLGIEQYDWLLRPKLNSHQVPMPHPYLSYIRKKSELDRIDKNQNVNEPPGLGIFGGSVAEGLRSQRAMLRSALDKTFGMENLNTYFFAHGGYRQPQQLIASMLFSKNLRYAVNLEGVNEIFAYRDGSFPDNYPMNIASLLFYSGYENYLAIGKLIKLRTQAQSLFLRLRDKKYLFKAHKNFDQWRLHKAKIELLNLQLPEKNSHHSAQNSKAEFSKRLKQWMLFSCMQQNLAASMGTSSLFFIQPIPHLFKNLSTEEIKILSENEPHKEAVLIYSKLTNKNLNSIRDAGLNIYSLLEIFKNESDHIYTDGCCHINEKGRKKLIGAMVKSFSLLNEKPKYCDSKSLADALERDFK